MAYPSLTSEESTAPLHKRIESFLQCFDKLKSRRRKFLLLSYDWFEKAARVKRRVLARGGNDHTFFDDICKAIDNKPQLSPDRKVDMKARVRRMFLFDEETFTFWVPGPRGLRTF
jgi:hypothetical protein